MSVLEPNRIIAALEAVASEVRRSPTYRLVLAPQVLISSIQLLASEVRRHGAEGAQHCALEVRSLLLPRLEPLRQDWNPLKALRVEKDEPSWTQWLAHLLDMRDRPSGQLAWRALCSTVEQELREHPITPSSSRLADAQKWEGARSMAPAKVVPERPTGDGYVDVWVELPGMRIALENKLWESWHDSGEKPQATKYHDFALLAAPDESHVGLVYLSVEPATEAEQRYGWVFITWAQFARAIRRELLRELGHESRSPLGADEALGFIPLVLTLSAIESALLGLRRDLINEHQLEWHHLEPLIALKRYLEESK